MTRRFNPRAAALAYRIWAYCAPRGWNCTITEIADELGEKRNAISLMCYRKKWLDRLRRTSHNGFDVSTFLYTEIDDQGPIKL